jgi:hypothetical protein
MCPLYVFVCIKWHSLDNAVCMMSDYGAERFYMGARDFIFSQLQTDPESHAAPTRISIILCPEHI